MKEETLYTKYGKNIIDRVLGFLIMVCFAWLFLIIAAAVYLDDPGPILYKQRRVGKKENGQITYFNILKFRTMKVRTPELPTHLLQNPEQYITRVGRLLRKTSLDELPQMWNIAIEHNLSLVGPRPALWSQSNLIAEREKYGANEIMPGLTGWAQVNGRDKLKISEKARLDGEYVQKMSFAFDLKCFLRTFVTVLKCAGIAEGSAEQISGKDQRKEGAAVETTGGECGGGHLSAGRGTVPRAGVFDTPNL